MTPRPSSAVHLQVDDTYLPEVWVWFAIGVVVIFARWAVRIRTVGFRGLDDDDLISIPLSDRDVWVLEYGSKWEYASFFTYCAIIWCLKFMVLFFYRRLKADEWRQAVLTVKRLFWINGLAYIALFMTAMLGCRPYFNPSTPPHLMLTKADYIPKNFWVLVILNVLTDGLIMTIPVPILWQLRVFKMRKVGVSLLLCSGVFVISTAVVRAAFTIAGAPSVITINRWEFRETAVGMLAVNAPVLIPIFSKAFWARGPYRPGRQPGQAQGAGIFGGGNHGNRRRPADAPRPTVFQIPSEMTWTTRGATSHGTSEQTELSKLSKVSRPGHTRDTGDTRDLEKGPDTVSGAVETRTAECRTEQAQDDMAIPPTTGVG
uniref:Rhodopsin domain-containing protein n=1 Tax=Gnomonia sp. TaxID=2011790 RepID=A0AAU8CHT8_9PEZI